MTDLSPKDLEDQLWRLNNLYYIRDENGKEVQFRLNWMQIELYRQMWYLNCILKARQLGCTTFIDLFALDTCLFNIGYHAGIIAETEKKAKSIYADKIKYPYERLPEALIQTVRADTNRADEITFSNDSKISVSTSFRSGTYQFLHVSEYGKISVQRPDKAKEIKSGSFETVHAGNMIFIESTAEGRAGDFYEMCEVARKIKQTKAPLTELDFKFFFFPWWRHPKYVLDPTHVPIPQRMQNYFKELEIQGIELSRAQKAWYVKKEQRLGEDIKSQHPSTPEEAFEASIKGAIFASQMNDVREQGRITKVPFQKGIPVDTWWDIGYGDDTAIWFTQNIGRSIHVINYYENSGEGAGFYAKKLTELSESEGYWYGIHKGPHDLDSGEWGANKTKYQSALSAGIKFEVVPRVQDKWDSVQAARNILPICVFDEEKCEVGIIHLDGYRKEWNDKHGCFHQRPLHDEHSNGADAFQTLGLGHEFIRTTHRRGGQQQQKKAAGWT